MQNKSYREGAQVRSQPTGLGGQEDLHAVQGLVMSYGGGNVWDSPGQLQLIC